MQNLVEIGLSGSGEEDENVKSLRQRQQRQQTNCDQKSSLEPSSMIRHHSNYSYKITSICNYSNVENINIKDKYLLVPKMCLLIYI